ncbi:MAG: response regulator [Pseudomonadota bacterium]
MTAVLVVEDDRNIARSVCLRLKANGIKAAAAYDAISATTVARRCQPDVAILDITMPGGDGFTVAERLRSLFPNIEIVFLTANSHPDTRSRAQALAPKAFVNKPFAAEELLAAIA